MHIIHLKNKSVGSGYPTLIIAETAMGHEGSIEKAKKIIDSASKAKVDAINFHITSLKDYMVPHYTAGIGKSSSTSNTKPLFEYINEISLDWKDWEILIPYARSKGLLISALCNDIQSEKFISKLEPDLYSIHASGIAEEQLIKNVAQNKKPVILNIGGCTICEIDKAIEWIRDEGNQDICLLYGIQTYPTAIENAKIGYIKTLQNIYGIPTGMSDHTDGDSELALVVPVAGVVVGANIVEKHVTNDRSLKGEDYESALDEAGIIKLVDWIRKIESALKDPYVKQLNKEELFYRSVSMKKIVAAIDIKKNEKITHENIAAKRSDEGLEFGQLALIENRLASRDIKKDEGITLDKVI